ncbi:MAG: patatin-like phospholipase family protein [Xanthomonadales bacterium]|jgi:NTE family protein|nr:patatin-like phospholipase family protein [Xanthomonadales bacterium]
MMQKESVDEPADDTGVAHGEREGQGGRRISLVLGSGGARGHAHLGVIRALEEQGFRIRNLAGTSMGAVIGGIYAAGALDTYQEWAYRLEVGDVVKLLDFSFRGGVFKGERVFEVLGELIGHRQIEQLSTGFVAVATDIDAQREIWLNSGSLFQAVRASSAVPGVFAPVRIAGRTLVDGGLVNPIPIAPTLNDDTDLTVAVNLNAMSGHYLSRPPKPRERTSPEDMAYRSRIKRFVAELFSNSDANATPGAAQLMVRSIDVMQGAIARLKLAAYVPDIVVEIPRDSAGFFEFNRAEELAQLGYESTLSALRESAL